MLLYVSGVTNFDFPRGYQNNILRNKEKPKKYVSFILKDGLYSGYFFLGAQLCQCLLVGTLPAGIPSLNNYYSITH